MSYNRISVLTPYLKKAVVFLLFSFFTVSYTYAQSDTIVILNQYKTNSGLALKWLPTSDVTFLSGYNNGYDIYRSKVLVSSNGAEELEGFVKINTTPVMPWSEDKLEAEMAKDSTLEIAGIFIYGAEELKNRFPKSTMAEAFEQKEQDEMLHMLASFMTISKNSLAEALGMSFLDKNVEPGQKYLYKIEVNAKEKVTSYLLIPEIKEEPSAKVVNVSVELYPEAVYLSWFNNQNKEFPYFNIYRSEKENKGYMKLNDVPYVGQQGNADFQKNFSSITDSFPSYNKTYYYKIVGVNAFETEGIPSDPVKVYTNYLLKNAPRISKTTEVEGGAIKLDWEMASIEADFVESYSIYRAPASVGPYLKVNSKPISSQKRSFVDDTPKGSSNYYVLSAFGSSGDSINSVLKSHLLLDSIPPARPVMISGKCDTNGVVTLKWELNPEKDLLGYRIFRTYHKNLDPDRITPDDTLTTVYADTVNLKMNYTKIYYRIHALDGHYNPSLPSEYLEVELPDFNPPTSGFVSSFSVGMSGIQVKWKNSKSKDLETMYLMRKADTDYEFTPIAVFNGDSLSIESFVDTNTVAFARYEYAVQAQDQSGLKSQLSNTILIEQLDKRKVPSVTALKAISSKENKMIKLTWEFNTRATSFRIYRSRNGEDLQTYTYTGGQVREFYDKHLKPRSNYTYQIVAEMEGGYTSGYSETIEIKY